MWRRCLTTSTSLWNSPSKSVLSKLRKATGYSFTKCKEALQKHDNDLTSAEKWLRQEAQAHGWQKATKLQGRATSQGLISVSTSPQAVVMTEINCETDFVARNKKFRALATQVSNECLRYVNSLQTPNTWNQIELTGEEIGQIATLSGRKLIEDVVLQIGEIGENIGVRRAISLHAAEPILLSGCTHPTDSCNLGKYGALIAFTASGKKPFQHDLTANEIGRRLCQHVIGMSPLTIGDQDTEPVENIEDETAMLYQEYLLETELTVKDFIDQCGVSLLHFNRFECGEEVLKVDEKKAWETQV